MAKARDNVNSHSTVRNSRIFFSNPHYTCRICIAGYRLELCGGMKYWDINFKRLLPCEIYVSVMRIVHLDRMIYFKGRTRAHS